MNGYEIFDHHYNDIHGDYDKLLPDLREHNAQQILAELESYVDDCRQILKYVKYCLGNSRQPVETVSWMAHVEGMRHFISSYLSQALIPNLEINVLIGNISSHRLNLKDPAIIARHYFELGFTNTTKKNNSFKRTRSDNAQAEEVATKKNTPPPFPLKINSKI